MKQLTQPELEHLRNFFNEFWYLYNTTSEDDSAVLDELVFEAQVCAEFLGVPTDQGERDE